MRWIYIVGLKYLDIPTLYEFFIENLKFAKFVHNLLLYVKLHYAKVQKNVLGPIN